MTDPPELPDDLEDRILEILAGKRAEHAARLDALAHELPEHAAAIRAYAEIAGITPSGRRIGHYELLRELGSGGMGVVWLAEQTEPVHRRVALKVLRVPPTHADHDALIKRLDREREALARMTHTNIARVHDAGTTDDGEPYVVMEYVPGVPIDRYCEDAKLGITARLRLFQQVCAGVQHAHQKGILHRDLKPQNILVTVEGGEARVKIIDFGLARPTDPLGLGDAMLTEVGEWVGTPEYMSPEQATGQELDTTSDVYALGVILYELITGELPFPSRELRRAGALEMLRVIREVDPPKPSARVTRHRDSKHRPTTEIDTSLRSWINAVRGDLDWITMRALEKDRTRRYQTAEALSSDIQRHLDLDPVSAGPPSAGYRLRKLARKYRVQFAGAAVAVLGLAVGLTASVLAWRSSVVAWASEREQRTVAERQRDRGDRLLDGVRVLSVVPALERETARVAALLPAWPERRAALEEWAATSGEELRANLTRLRATRIEELGGADDLADLRSTMRSGLARMSADVEPRVAELLDDVRASVAWSHELERLMRVHADRWARAVEAIRASPRYPQQRIPVQTGLVPIGPDPDSGLQEFVHLRSSDVDRLVLDRDAEGRYPLTGATGIVFVLIPADAYELGAQARDPERPFYDPDASADARTERVVLDAFFVSKYELARSQWKRLDRGSDPSGVATGALPGLAISDLHPVEQVSWSDADRVMRRHGLALPTAAQWEVACRAGATTPWCCGPEPGQLARCANLADRAARTRIESEWAGGYEPWDDGHPFHAPVGSFAANAFGLHDVHGNVQEWCADVFDAAWDGERRRGTGEWVVAADTGRRAARGGSFYDRAHKAKATWIGHDAASFTRATVGLRPARALLD